MMDNFQKNPKDIKTSQEISGRKIAVYLNMATYSPAIELHTAIMIDLLKRHNKVTAYICDDSFSSPMDNPFNRRSIESFKMFRAKSAVKTAGVELKKISLSPEPFAVPEKIKDVLELGVMSSFASLLKVQSKQELNPKWLEAYNNMLQSSAKLYNFFIKEIQKEGYDFVFMYNGRFGDVRPVLEAAKEAGSGFGLVELKRITLPMVCVNELVHSILGNTRRALSFYEKDKRAAEANAEKFFLRRLAKKDQKEPIYTKSQDKGSLPDRVLTTNKKVVAVYPTTDDEYKFIGKEWEGNVPQDQVKEIEEMIKNLTPEKYLVVVKMHPNQEYTAEDTLARYMDLAKKYPNVVVEKPLSKKDSYALMNRADFVVVFASTIGFEATYAGKPVILIGDTTWGNMDIAHKVYTGSDAANLVLENVAPKPKLGAIIWGNYYDAYKDDLGSFSVDDKERYFINDKMVGQSVLRRVLMLPAKTEITINRPGFKYGIAFLYKIRDAIIGIMGARKTLK